MAEENDRAGGSSEDRRDSYRVPLRLGLRRAGSADDFVEKEGDLSLGGFAWKGEGLEADTRVEVRFKLSDASEEIQVSGQVLKVTTGPEGPAVHARFDDLSMESELAIARYLDDVRLKGQ